jgi:hypothetical protein
MLEVRTFDCSLNNKGTLVANYKMAAKRSSGFRIRNEKYKNRSSRTTTFSLPILMKKETATQIYVKHFLNIPIQNCMKIHVPGAERDRQTM